jgi:hypothetical protein
LRCTSAVVFAFRHQGQLARRILECSLPARSRLCLQLPAHTHKTSLAHLNLDVTDNSVDALLVVAAADMAASIHRTIDRTTPVASYLAGEIEVTSIDTSI